VTGFGEEEDVQVVSGGKVVDIHYGRVTIMLMYLPIDQMVADMFTKPLSRPALTRHQSSILGHAEPMQRFTP
jgi:hypothetical protein